MFTPQEIQEQTFSKAVFGGYDMQQVDDFLEPLTEDYIMLYKENSVLKSKMKVLVEKLEEYRGQEAAMKQQMAQAQAQCDRMIAEAQSRSATIVAGAETTLRSQSDDLKKELAEEQTRLDDAKRTALNFIDVIEHDIKGHLELLEKLKAMLKKEQERRIKLNNRIAILERRIQEESAAEVADMVRTANVTPEQLAILLRQAATMPPTPAALSAVGAEFDKEEINDEI